ncbi:hypothetical protein ACJQWK_00018 [Exserohilum turcicum]|uniref:Uncharacterized protein n=1 Tax=Exserohilum turcicum (strain 28A) TaxID=671987 RepID=R0K1D5_EXST2|nr:uncharacterized protein SETTUDRAFT_180615 [Exserohilum turcica Et28A]EOA83484.1 hypothetical protein SETTUDRAFT_180615 [Exserohilum turcica Et28A]
MSNTNESIPFLRGGGNCHSCSEGNAAPPPPAPRRVAAVEVIEKSPMSEEEMQRGLDTIGFALSPENEPPIYRIIGAGALWAMGMKFRETSDFDILVPGGAVQSTKKKLLENEKFGKSALKSTYVKIGSKNFNVDVIPHPRAHLDEFPGEEYPQYLTSASVAPLECMIQTKIGAYRDSARVSKQAKHIKDSADQEFLFSKAVEKGLYFGFDGMSGLDRDFADDFRNFRREAAQSLDFLTIPIDKDGDVEMADA